MKRRAPFSLAPFVLLALSSCTASTAAATASISGDALDFTVGLADGPIASAHVYVLEDPTLDATTDAAGHFVIEDVPVGSDATLVLEHADYIPIQTATFEVPAEGLTRITFQAVTPPVRDALAAILSVTIDPTRCQMVTTITRIGRSLYDPGAHGEAGATVTIDPPLPASAGPIYFNSEVRPDRTLTESSDDGGVLFVNVPPGTYTWTATKPGATFAQVRMTCRAGMLVNASPPWGLQREQ
ncbi:MAG: carboxypeptidase-like regulatory domain-containing protein [Sandaracinus sp.]